MREYVNKLTNASTENNHYNIARKCSKNIFFSVTTSTGAT